MLCWLTEQRPDLQAALLAATGAGTLEEALCSQQVELSRHCVASMRSASHGTSVMRLSAETGQAGTVTVGRSGAAVVMPAAEEAVAQYAYSHAHLVVRGARVGDDGDVWQNWVGRGLLFIIISLKQLSPTAAGRVREALQLQDEPGSRMELARVCALRYFHDADDLSPGSPLTRSGVRAVRWWRQEVDLCELSCVRGIARVVPDFSIVAREVARGTAPQRAFARVPVNAQRFIVANTVY